MEGGLKKRLPAALRRLQAGTGVPLAFAGTTVAGNRIHLSHFYGTTAGALAGVKLDAGYGLGGRVMTLDRPVAVEDYLTTEAIRHRYDSIIMAEGLHAMVAAPVIVRRQPVAVIYAAARDILRFGSRTLDMVAAEARELEQQLAVEAALDDQAREAMAVASAIVGAQIAEVGAELRALAREVSDENTRRLLLNACARVAGPPTRNALLTPRENDVIALVAQVQSNATIARELGLTVYTVKSYLKTAMQKLGARTRFEAVMAAQRANGAES